MFATPSIFFWLRHCLFLRWQVRLQWYFFESLKSVFVENSTFYYKKCASLDFSKIISILLTKQRKQVGMKIIKNHNYIKSINIYTYTYIAILEIAQRVFHCLADLKEFCKHQLIFILWDISFFLHSRDISTPRSMCKSWLFWTFIFALDRLQFFTYFVTHWNWFIVIVIVIGTFRYTIQRI